MIGVGRWGFEIKVGISPLEYIDDYHEDRTFLFAAYFERFHFGKSLRLVFGRVGIDFFLCTDRVGYIERLKVVAARVERRKQQWEKIRRENQKSTQELIDNFKALKKNK